MAEHAARPEPVRRALTGWGRTAPSVATVHGAGADLAAIVRDRGSRGVLARGLGRSYGDAAQNGGGDVVRVPGGWTAYDATQGVVEAEGGVSLDQLIDTLLPAGAFPMTTPGTRFVTIGGAIASDVHGKNHHRDGSFGDHVRELDLIGADGEVRTLTPDGDPDAFWGTVGGMGLTGVITRAAFRVRPVESSWILARKERLDDLDSLLQRMVALDATSTYTVAWVDLQRTGRGFGRSVLDSGEHAVASELTGAAAGDPFRLPRRPALRVPPIVPSGLINQATTRAFNEAWWRKAPRDHEGLEHLGAFFYPLDGLHDWNRGWGPRGFVQYQFVVPDEATETLVRILHRIADSGRASFLNVLKRLGPGNPGMLSFPRQGWTLAVDLAADAEVGALLRGLDREVLDAGGRVYLSKDGRLSAEDFGRMYPRLAEFGRLRDRLSATGAFCSDLSRRLGLDETGMRAGRSEGDR